MNRLLQSKKRGSAIPLAIVVVLILLAMGTGLLSMGLNSRTISLRTTSDITARCAADAGLTKALFEMNEKLKVKPWDGSSLPLETEVSLPNCDAVYNYTVTSDAGVYTIQSTGTSNQAQRTVSCTLQLRGPFEAAIFTEGFINLANADEVDWYNYDAGDANLKVGTNSTAEGSVWLANSATIKGDVAVGVGGDPETAIELKSGATIEGQSTALTEEVELPPVTVPEALQTLPSGGDIIENTTITSSGKYSSIDLGNSETVIISGDVTLYITGDIILGNSAELQIEEGSSLTLYLGGDFEGKNSSAVNNLTEDAKQLQIYGLDSCETIIFKNSSDLYGAIYAPNADVIMNNSATVYGAVVGKTFDMQNSGVFMYDASLRDVSMNDELVRFEIKRWYE
ncbi:MAG TPA: collagen-binding domain-containing protein [Sedimentisphaerales bacterium]|nr:collagen-binding domain-containing protein [Sedimentisphaerales bacterium]